MGKYVYVDNSNLFIEGMRVSAVQGGRASNVWDAAKKGILDELYRIDFGKLHNILADGNPSNIFKAVLFGSRPPANDSLWKMAEKAGFETTIEDRNVAGQEKRVDTGIVTAIMADAYTIIKKGDDEIILVAGDGDYVPTVDHLIKNGHYMDVFFWDHASMDLKKACRRFRPLDPHLKNIQFDKI